MGEFTRIAEAHSTEGRDGGAVQDSTVANLLVIS